MRILLAEDDNLLGDGLRAGLRQAGFLVDWVRDGAAAERELRAQPYAAAVLDLGLPRMSGIDVTRVVKGKTPSVEILIFTIFDEEDKVLEAVMTDGRKVAGGDLLGKTVVFAKNVKHAEFIERRFNANYPIVLGIIFHFYFFSDA